MALLLYLVVERERTRDSVLGVLWPERDQEKARHALNQTLYELRRALGSEWLTSDGNRLRVAESVTVDVARFEQAIKEHADTRALELYGGPYLEGLHLWETSEFEAWVDGVRGRCARLFREANRRVVQARLATRDVPGALSLAQRWVELEPLEDEAHYQLIALLAESGRRGEALREFESYERQLSVDGLEPVTELKDLIKRIRAGEIGAPLRIVASSPQESGPRRRFGALERTTVALGSSQPIGPRLVRILEGGGEAEAYLLQHETNVIGRAEGNLVFPEDALMSAVHAEISVRPAAGQDGEPPRQFFIRDAGSRNGVYLRIPKEWPLHEGDQFAVGRQVFRFERAKSDDGFSPGNAGVPR
jgi:DNA-binding SARP family transcriptional activator